MKEFKRSKRSLLYMSIALVAGALLFLTPISEASKKGLIKVGENSLRVGSLGGEVAISDPTSPIYKASIGLGVNDFLVGETERNFILFQIDNAGKIKNDKNGNPRKLEVKPTGSTKQLIRGNIALKPRKKKKGTVVPFVFPKPELTDDKAHSNILILYIDSDDDGTADKFPIYFIKDLKYRNYKLSKKFGAKGVYFPKARLPIFETFADLPGDGVITLVQVVETPIVAVELAVPSKLKPVGGDNFVAVGPPVNFKDITTLLGTGENTSAPTTFKGTILVPYYADVVDSLGFDAENILLFKQKGKKYAPVNATITISTDDATVSATNIDGSSLAFGTYMAVITSTGESNSLPVILDLKAKAKKSGKVKVKYILADGERDASNVKIEYRKSPTADADEGWTEIKTLSGVKPEAKKKRTFTWNSKSGEGTADASGYFQVRVKPMQTINSIEVVGAARVSKTFRIDNGGVSVNSPKEFSGTVTNYFENDIAGGIETNPPQVVLSWDAPAGDVSGYNIYRQARYRNGIDNALSIIKTIDDPSTVSYTDNVDNGTLDTSFFEAIYRITSFDSDSNESKYSKKLKLSSIVFGSYGYYGYSGGK